MEKIVIIYGPQASGKTVNAEALREHFGCKRTIDDWSGKHDHRKLEAGDLINTNLITDARQAPQHFVGVVPHGVAVEIYEIGRALQIAGVAHRD